RDPGVLEPFARRPLDAGPLLPGDVQVAVHAAGLGFRDVLKALNGYPVREDGPVWFGDGFSGVVTAVGAAVTRVRPGDRVMGVGAACMAGTVRTPAALVAPVPGGFTDEEAATFPVAYLTAYYSLVHMAGLTAGETVLIHSAATGTGLAALHIARTLGANVLATAGSETRRARLRELGAAEVWDSRTPGFGEGARRWTGARGVDVVLNSLAGSAVGESLGALGRYGRFVELGRRDIEDGSPLPLGDFRRDLTFVSVGMARVFQDRPELVGRLLTELAALADSGDLPALPTTSFPVGRAEDAFRLMARAGHGGAVAVTVVGADADADAGLGAGAGAGAAAGSGVGADVFGIGAGAGAGARADVGSGGDRPETAGGDRPDPVGRDRVSALGDTTCLVTGGLGRLGLKIAGRLLARGAGRVALVGRTAPDEEVRARLAALDPGGDRVTVHTADVSDEVALRELLDELDRSGPPLRGVVHGAAVSRDGIATGLTQERLADVLAAKAGGAWHLHTLTADRPLDFFVLCSSLASVLGSPGQADYAAANGFLDALAHQRHALGLPATSVNWGPWEDSDERAARGSRHWAARGIAPLSTEDALDALDRIIESAPTQAAVFQYQEEAVAGRSGQDRADAGVPAAAAVPLTPAVPVTAAVAPGTVRSTAAVPGHVRPGAPASDGPETERGDNDPAGAEGWLLTQLALVLGTRPERLDQENPFHEMGFDSLMALELRNRIERRWSVKLPATLLWRYPTPAALAGHLEEKLAERGERTADATGDQW
ncbi:type I polyketide synthase, partial [Streptomyces sp. W16]|uniref:type I polyketide synthase n=1 Tax=Streptomyces sp. W16 TaxID=3076631 RepID=UPI00295A65E0